jgi:hypothetical protein
MNRTDIKELIIKSLDSNVSTEEIPGKLEAAGVLFSFKPGFNDKVLDRIFNTINTAKSEIEFLRNLNFIFYRIALTGVAAIVVLLVSIFLMEGSLSFNSFLGLSDSDGERIVCLLTGI